MKSQELRRMATVEIQHNSQGHRRQCQSGRHRGIHPVVTFFRKPSNWLGISIMVIVVAHSAFTFRAMHSTLHKMLEDFDGDRSSRLSSQELQRLLQRHGVRLHETQVREMFGKVDDEGDGFDESELSQIISLVSHLPSASRQLQDLNYTSLLGDGLILALALMWFCWTGSFEPVPESHLEERIKEANYHLEKYRRLSKMSKTEEGNNVEGKQTIEKEQKYIKEDIQHIIAALKHEEDMRKAEAQSITDCIKGINDFFCTEGSQTTPPT